MGTDKKWYHAQTQMLFKTDSGRCRATRRLSLTDNIGGNTDGESCSE